MNCLPIVERELRVASRKRSTFWVRVAGAGTGLLIGGAFLFVISLQGTSTARIGSALFGALTWLCMAAALAAGLFFTSDCLSEEKREGTLGLLFLTELRGYDVGLGKLIATSLRGFYVLLAALPIIAVTQLMGGITGVPVLEERTGARQRPVLIARHRDAGLGLKPRFAKGARGNTRLAARVDFRGVGRRRN